MCSTCSIVQIIHSSFIPKATQFFHVPLMWPRTAVIFEIAPLLPSKCEKLHCDFMSFGRTCVGSTNIICFFQTTAIVCLQGQIKRGNALPFLRGLLISSFHCLYERDHKFSENFSGITTKFVRKETRKVLAGKYCCRLWHIL